MGVVYEAEDLKLGRRVAIKFLPEETAEPAAHERFEREARAASSLNHENICTIYEFGEHQGRPFIAMELLEGQTLDRVLSGQPLPVEQIVDYATQIADALDAAHRRGLVHRDIKPSNIFIITRHRAKILDFGLAKSTLTSSMETAADNTATAAHLTSPGSTVGTIAYMSPEQARGEDLDGRSDLFSFGAVLYQMATGALPFEGKTSAVIFHGILEKQQIPSIERNAAIPEKLDEIINKALEKDPDMRYQTAAEMRADLKRLKRDSSSGKTRVASSASAQVAIPSSSSIATPKPRSRNVLLIGGILILLIVVGVIGAYLYNSRAPQAPKHDIAFRALTDTGTVGDPLISPDGKLLAYINREGARSLHIKQIATGSDVEVVPPGPGFFGTAAFSPDGNYIYYTHTLADSPQYGLYVVPSLGGPTREVVSGVEAGIGVSNDGKQLAYTRRNVAANEYSLFVSNVDGSGERRIGPDGLPHTYMYQYKLSWSADSKTIATTIQLYNEHFGAIVLVPVMGGKPEILPFEIAPLSATWLQDGSGLLVLGVARSAQLTTQLYFQPYPKGDLVRVTNDLNNYQNASVTADSKTIVTGQATFQGDMYLGSITSPTDAKPLNLHKRFQSLAMIDNDRAVAVDNSLHFWTFKRDGSGLTEILQGDTLKQAPVPCSDGRTLVYMLLDEKNTARIARAEYNSNRGTPLSPGPLDGPAFCMPDGQSYIYVADRGKGSGDLMKGSFSGGAPTRIMSGGFDDLSVTPDHQSIVISTISDDGQKRSKIVKVISLKDFSTTHQLVIPPNAQGLDLLADNSALVYYIREGNYDNFFTMPLTGGAPKKITNFTSEHILTFEPTPDKKSILFERGSDTMNAVMISNFR